MATSRGLNPPQAVPKGTVWVSPSTGRVYRKAGRHWRNKFTIYTVLIGNVAFTVHRLPDDVVCVYYPTTDQEG